MVINLFIENKYVWNTMIYYYTTNYTSHTKLEKIFSKGNTNINLVTCIQYSVFVTAVTGGTATIVCYTSSNWIFKAITVLLRA